MVGVMSEIQEQGIKAKALQAAGTTEDGTAKSSFEIPLITQHSFLVYPNETNKCKQTNKHSLMKAARTSLKHNGNSQIHQIRLVRLALGRSAFGQATSGSWSSALQAQLGFVRS
ncbi:Uncharacterized protein HZ326_16214 [Fusarium oxysporum f. sp. albedinis]|nr:Uncharacterized protein HZ326_16214 [Fusarium oxysporum f. sp. albedinis]